MTTIDESTRTSHFSTVLLGFGVLALTVVFSNFPQLVQHPDQFFDVPSPNAVLRVLQRLGYGLQLAIGLWLAISLILDIRRARRVAAMLWPMAAALYFAPLPNARQDLALAPALFIGALTLTGLSWALDRATRQSA